MTTQYHLFGSLSALIYVYTIFILILQYVEICENWMNEWMNEWMNFIFINQLHIYSQRMNLRDVGSETSVDDTVQTNKNDK